MWKNELVGLFVVYNVVAICYSDQWVIGSLIDESIAMIDARRSSQCHVITDRFKWWNLSVCTRYAGTAVAPSQKCESPQHLLHQSHHQHCTHFPHPSYPQQQQEQEVGRLRATYSRWQTLELEKEFHYNRYLSRNRRLEVAYLVQLSEQQVKTWFQNRRMRWKREQASGSGISRGWTPSHHPSF